MRKFLKTFDNHSQYDDFTGTTEFILPNVSHCITENEVHYNPTIKVTGVTLNKSTLSLSEGGTSTLVATVLPNDASNKNVIWRSSNESVATVDSNGVVSGVSIGSADITVATEYGGFTAQCTTNVKSYKVITYAASAKLSETTSTDGTAGLHTNAFSGTNGQQLTMVSHIFDDGVGTITFNDTIKTVGNYAFYNCSNLTSIDIPDSVTSIGYSAFYYCSGLTSIDIPDSVTSIGNYAFQYCYSLTSIDIPGGVTSFGGYVFNSCTGLTSCTIGSGATSIGSAAFSACTSLTSIDIPDSVTSIGSGAFYNCSGLTSIDIPSGVTSIGNGTFNGCSSLTRLNSDVDGVFNIPSGVTSIGSSTFRECRRLTSIDIPSGVTTIGTSAFTYCTGLTTCIIGSGVTNIGDRAFESCRSLTSIDIPSGVTSIGSGAFNGCYGLTSMTVDSNNTVYDSRNNCNGIINTSTNTLIAGCKTTIIPDSVTSIGNSAFFECSSLTSIDIPSGVTSIGDRAFYHCTSLTSIVSNATTAPTIQSSTFQGVGTNGTLTVPIGSSGYDVWMDTSNYYLGKYNWTKVEQ